MTDSAIAIESLVALGVDNVLVSVSEIVIDSEVAREKVTVLDSVSPIAAESLRFLLRDSAEMSALSATSIESAASAVIDIDVAG